MIANLIMKRILFMNLIFALGCTLTSESKFVSAAGNGDLEQVKHFLEQGVNINCRANDDWTALTIAATEGHFKVIKLLVEYGADVNALEGGGNTALFWAAKYGYTNIVLYLLDQGAYPNKKCFDCRTPMEIAEINGHQDIVQVLKQASSLSE